MKSTSAKKCASIDRVQVKRIFDFLESNAGWNEDFQNYEFHRSLAYCASQPNPERSRVVELLHSTAATQSQPRMGLLSRFWGSLQEFDANDLGSMEAFTARLEATKGKVIPTAGPWERLFMALKNHDGWGPKTSALFVKNVLKIHQGDGTLHFWDDAKSYSIAPILNDRLYLPVDSVIVEIFRTLRMDSPQFDLINEFLHEEYDSDAMATWDDLWYWGFFTQVVNKPNLSNGTTGEATRKMAWNSEKFWCQAAAPKEREEELKGIASVFIGLFQGTSAP